MNQTIKDIIKSTLIWVLILFLLQMIFNAYFKKDPSENKQTQSIVIQAVDDSMVMGNLAQFSIRNTLAETITFQSPCDAGASDTLQVYRVINDQPVALSHFENCGDKTIQGFTLASGAEKIFSFRDYNSEIFSEPGKYQIEMQFKTKNGEIETHTSNPLTYDSPGIFRQLFRAIIAKPLFNLLVFFTRILPGHSFGLAIILVTIVTRLLLFIPNQKAMRSQRELQKLQPKIEEIKKKYGKNQQMVAMKTMEIYKTHKVNPMGSCLPILLQMPVLIGVYSIVRDGVSPHLYYLLYDIQGPINFVINSDFLLWDLDQKPDLSSWQGWLLPILVGGAQFLAINLSTYSAKKKAQKEGQKKKEPAEGMAAQMEQMQVMMKWILPVMIGFFTASFPAGVGIYWLTSTTFGIFQQKYVNWKLDQPQVRRKED